MPNPSFEKCALIYLGWWVEHDRPCHDALTDRSTKDKVTALRNYAVEYGINRTLSGKDDDGTKYRPVLKVLEDKKLAKPLRANAQPCEVARVVEWVSKSLARHYGGKNKNLPSPASKFLWVKFQKPFLPYDRLTRIALNFLMCEAVGTRVREYDLDAFYKAWYCMYKKHQGAVKEACGGLDDLDDKYGVSKEVSRPWFRERVFDVWLMDVGRCIEAKAKDKRERRRRSTKGETL